MQKFFSTLFVCLVLFSSSSQAQVSVTIDVDKTGEPISPYIYGQFTEHLGRCIYDGIWSEMLQDRKFYYAVSDEFNPWGTASDSFWKAGEFKYLNASPWQVIGPKGIVTMDSLNAYTGSHSPALNLPGNNTQAGLRQDGLIFIGGKEYDGHIVLKGTPQVVPVNLRLKFATGYVDICQVKKLKPGFAGYAFKFKAPKAAGKAALEITSTGQGLLTIGTVSIMPADNIKGWRKDVVALLKQLNSPIYRWPGGNFVSGYNWRDGIGERDKRPPRKNPAWRGVEHNDVGIHEFMDLMDILDAEPYIAVNTGLGTVEEVAREVEYCNGAATTEQGKYRAKNGRTQPWAVKWWAVGNEMYGNWQLGHMPLAEYVQKHNRVAEAMRKVDPNIKLVGVGEVGDWSKIMLQVCANNMDLISEHIYCQEKPNVLAHTRQLAEQIKRKADAHRQYRKELPELAGKDIRIAMDEWNYWYGDYIYGELGVRYHLKDALGIATGLHEFFRNSDMYYMANYAQTVNVIGCIKTSQTDAVFAATGLPLVLYRQQFGTIPVQVSGEFGDLDVSAAWTADKKALTIAVINPDPQTTSVQLNIPGSTFKEQAVRWIIDGDDPESYNEPDNKPNLAIVNENVQLKDSILDIPGYGIVLYRLEK